jgi:hypothetical protein
LLALVLEHLMDDQNVVRRKTRVIDYNKTIRIQRKRDHVVDPDESLLKNLEASLNQIYSHLGTSTNLDTEEINAINSAAGYIHFHSHFKSM